MASILERITSFLGNTFGNAQTGPKLGGILGVALGAGAGYWLGGSPVTAVLGAGAGVFGGALLNNLVETVLDRTGIAPKPKVQPTPQAGQSVDMSVQIGGQSYTVTTPREKPPETAQLPGDRPAARTPVPQDTLTRPWGEEGSAAYVRRMREDNLRVLRNPEDKQASVELLTKTLEERNQQFYDFLASAQKFNADYVRYNNETRPQIIRDLGFSESTPLSGMLSPPKYEKPLAFKLDMKLDEPTRADLNISAEDWAKKDSVSQLALIEQSVDRRMLQLSEKFAKLNASGEALERNAGLIDIDWTGKSALNRLKWATGSLISPTVETQLQQAAEKYGKNPAGQNEAEAERVFRAEMDAIAGQVSGSGKTGEANAAMVRELASLMVEQRRLQIQWESVQVTKEIWASEAERWLPDAMAFRKELTDYTGQFEGGKRSNRDFVLMRELTTPIPASEEAKRRTAELQQDMVQANDMLRRGVEGLEGILNTISSGSGQTTLVALQPIDIEKQVRNLPTQDNLSNGMELPSSSDPVQKQYLAAAKRLSDMLGVPVRLSIMRDDGVPRFELARDSGADTAKVKTALEAARNAAGLSAEQMPLSVEFRNLTIPGKALMALDAGNQPTGMKEDVFAKLATQKDALKAAVEPIRKDSMLRGQLEDAALKYNAALAAWKADQGNNQKKAVLIVSRESLGEAVGSYARQAEIWVSAQNNARKEQMAELAKESSVATPLEGVEGFRIFVRDKRQGSNNQMIVLEGVKKDGQYTVTGWARMKADETLGEVHRFGKSLTDTEGGMALEPDSLKGLNEVMARITGSGLAFNAPGVEGAETDVLARARESVAFQTVRSTDFIVLPNAKDSGKKDMMDLA